VNNTTYINQQILEAAD